MSALTRTSLRLTALTIPALALAAVAACSPTPPGPGPGTGGAAVGTGGAGTATGGAAATGGSPTATGGASSSTGGAANGTGGAATTGGAANSGGSGNATGGATTGTGGGDPGTGGTVGSGECNLPDLPEGPDLTYFNEKLPSPFVFYDGTPVTTKEQWECRRKEILAMADKYIYGPVPPTPDSVTGTVSGSTVNISVTVGSNTQTFTATISGSGSIIALNLGMNGIIPGGSKSLSLGSGNEAKIRNLFGLSELNPNVANGWMIDRVMDVLEQNPSSGHDPTKMMVTGCSGCGKGAFLAGVFSRVPLTVIVESGGGGASNLRQAEWFRHGEGAADYNCSNTPPQSIDNLEPDGICGPWVTSRANWLAGTPSKVYNLPFDQHLLLATIAPRYLLHFTNSHAVGVWCHLGGTCEALSGWAAKPVWNALGVPERMGFMQYDSGHCGNPGVATSLAGEFFARAFQGDTTAETDVMSILMSGLQQPFSEWEPMWIDWDMNTVLQ